MTSSPASAGSTARGTSTSASSWACFQRLRDAGSSGLTADELAQRTGTEPRLVHDWAWGADAHDLVAIDAGRITLPEDIAVVLLDADRSEYLGGQFLHAAIGSLDYGHLLGGVPERHARRRRGRTATAPRSSG